MGQTGAVCSASWVVAVAIASVSLLSSSVGDARAQSRAFWIFVSLPSLDQVAMIDFDTLAVTNFDVSAPEGGPNRPWGITASPQLGAVVAILNESNFMAVLIPGFGQIAGFPLGPRPTNGEIDPTDPQAGWVALQGNRSVQEAGSNGPGAIAKTDARTPWDVAISATNIVVGGKKGADLLDPAAFARGAARGKPEIKGKDVRSVDCNSTGTECAASDFKLNKLTLFDPDTGTINAEVNLRKHKRPYGVDYFPGDDDILAVASNKKNEVVCIDASDARVAAAAALLSVTKVGKRPTEVEWLGSTGYLAVANSGDSTVSIVQLDQTGGAFACTTVFTIPLAGPPQDVAVLPKS